MDRIKTFTAREANRILRRSGAFGSVNRSIVGFGNEKEFHSIVYYIEENPVKAGLCRRAAEWKWGSATEERPGESRLL
jgi:hypothetical protein